MSPEFNRFGFALQYPENWEIEFTDPDEEGNYNFSVTGPSGAFWALSVHPEEVDPEAMVDGVLEMLQSEYQGVEYDRQSITIEDIELDGYEINFFCMDLTNTANVYAFRQYERTFVVFWQAEDRELADLEPIFDALNHSLLNGLSEF